ncbi:unnamed protein product [Rotaria socialis]|uniref:Structural maintenance of chromosomes protein 6 n=1 Tax=Rotaria socialis TaxID=392032 RepID=A0A820EHA5_9BILA|nr:unnamed protein product [Rotaria socialis]
MIMSPTGSIILVLSFAVLLSCLCKIFFAKFLRQKINISFYIVALFLGFLIGIIATQIKGDFNEDDFLRATSATWSYFELLQAAYFDVLFYFKSAVSPLVKSLLFGSTLSTTDPVSIVTLLQSCGARHSLSSLIESESLLNDGSFAIGQVVSDIVRYSLNGTLLGLFCGFICVFILKRINNDLKIEITITFGIAYLVFYVADVELGVSAVLSLISMGLYMSKHRYCRSNAQLPLAESWKIIVFVVNILIFTLSGLTIAHSFVGIETTLTSRDIVIALVLYLLIHASRALIVGVLYPVITWSGMHLNRNECVIFAWSGLRGRTALALVLLVYLDSKIPRATRERFLFHISMIVLLTLIINGISSKFLVKMLDLHREKLLEELDEDNDTNMHERLSVSSIKTHNDISLDSISRHSDQSESPKHSDLTSTNSICQLDLDTLWTNPCILGPFIEPIHNTYLTAGCYRTNMRNEIIKRILTAMPVDYEKQWYLAFHSAKSRMENLLPKFPDFANIDNYIMNNVLREAKILQLRASLVLHDLQHSSDHVIGIDLLFDRDSSVSNRTYGAEDLVHCVSNRILFLYLNKIMPKRGSTTSGTVASVPRKKQKSVEPTYSQNTDEQDENTPLNHSNYFSQLSQLSKQSPDLHKNAGTILRVSVKNFMCHTFLEFDFNENLNMVIGNNGSGKSAVMNAITLTLGGRATSTSRCSNIGRFIQHGKGFAEISVVLCNQGLEAIDIERFGRSITITRKVTVKGSSHYQVKNEYGKIVSERKDTIDTIVAHFNIQVDNPMCMLNQDIAKNFLNTKSTKEKYNFFLKATQLQKMVEDLEENTVEIRIAKGLLVDHVKKRKEIQAQKEELDAKLKFAESVRNAKSNADNLQGHLEWAEVINHEKTLAETEKKLVEDQYAVQEYTNKRDALIDDMKNEKSKRDELLRKAQEVANNAIEAKRIHDDLERQMKLFNKEKRDLLHEVSKLEKELQLQTELKKKLQKKIEEMRRKATGNNDYEKACQRINELHILINEQRQILSMKESEQGNFRQLYDDERQTLFNDQSTLKQHEDTLRRKRGGIQQLKAAKQDRVTIYGRYTLAILKEIDKHAHRFKQIPIGPVGKHIRLVDRKWAIAVEQAIGNSMQGYLCSCRDDERVLLEILSRCVPAQEMDYRPSVTVMKYQSKVYQNLRLPPSSFTTILSMLQIDNPTVTCFLIDHARIEQRVLMDNYETARRIMERSAPPNCVAAYLPNGTEMQNTYVFRCYTCRVQNPRFFVEDFAEQITRAENECITIERNMLEVKEKIKETQQRVNQHQQTVAGLDGTINEIRATCGRLGKELRELQLIEAPNDSNMDDCENELSEYDTRIETFKQRIKDQKSKAEIESPEYRQILDDVAQARQRVMEKREEAEQCKTSLQACDALKENGQRAINELQRGLDDNQRKLEQHEATKKFIETKLQIQIENAQKLLNQKPEGEIDVKATRRRLDGILKFIETNKNVFYDVQQIKDRSEKVKIALDTFGRVVDKQEKLVHKLFKASRHRGQQYKNLLEATAKLTSSCFTSFLESRNYTGEAIFDHKEGTLALEITPRGDEVHKDTRSLSGGERSFSTVCFMLALWEVVEMPLRCLDEFDVFMDHVTRRTAMNLVLEVAREKKKQYIFLTPQDLSFLKITDDMRILRMPQPKRTLMEINNDNDAD